jgi:hypothetical protein
MSTTGDFGCAFLDSFRARQKIDIGLSEMLSEWPELKRSCMIEAMLQRETSTKHVVSETPSVRTSESLAQGVVYPEKATGGATQLMIAYPVDLLFPRFEKTREFGQDQTYDQ